MTGLQAASSVLRIEGLTWLVSGTSRISRGPKILMRRGFAFLYLGVAVLVATTLDNQPKMRKPKNYDAPKS